MTQPPGRGFVTCVLVKCPEVVDIGHLTFLSGFISCLHRRSSCVGGRGFRSPGRHPGPSPSLLLVDSQAARPVDATAPSLSPAPLPQSPRRPPLPTHKSPWFLYLPSPPSHPGPRLLPTSPEPPSNSCHSPAPVSPTAPYSARRKSTGLRAQGSLRLTLPTQAPPSALKPRPGLSQVCSNCFFSYPLSWQGLLSKPHHHLLN